MQPPRPGAGKRSQTDDVTASGAGEIMDPTGPQESPKKTRPRSRTFTFSKGGQSPSKKQKSERPTPYQRNKSSGLTPSTSSTSLASLGSADNSSIFSKANKPAVPQDYITYLMKVQAPDSVEVGKIHKLRQVLRNETVDWIDSFVRQDGMTELVDLLYRIIKVEWRWVIIPEYESSCS